KKICILLVVILIPSTIFAQTNKIDSLISIRNTNTFDGKVPTYYIPGLEVPAKEYQEIVQNAIKFYEDKYSVSFQLKMVVLDSANWVSEILPYGFFYCRSGWILVPGDITYSTFPDIYGMRPFADKLEKALNEVDITGNQFINIRHKMISLHELGHYYFSSLCSVKSPDRWINEIMAWYFAFCYLKEKEPEYLKVYEVFMNINIENYKPKYKTIFDFDTLSSKLGVENYGWFQYNFLFLANDIYDINGINFITTYKGLFSQDGSKKYTVEEITELMDRHCEGIVRKWREELEN
ncbi:hypothetical protein ACFL55_02495, partial [Candidatus Latescibacterota bacterium]